MGNQGYSAEHCLLTIASERLNLYNPTLRAYCAYVGLGDACGHTSISERCDLVSMQLPIENEKAKPNCCK